MWVSFKECEFKGATFIKGILVDVISDNDRTKYKEYLLKRQSDNIFTYTFVGKTVKRA